MPRIPSTLKRRSCRSTGSCRSRTARSHTQTGQSLPRAATSPIGTPWAMAQTMKSPPAIRPMWAFSQGGGASQASPITLTGKPTMAKEAALADGWTVSPSTNYLCKMLAPTAIKVLNRTRMIQCMVFSLPVLSAGSEVRHREFVCCKAWAFPVAALLLLSLRATSWRMRYEKLEACGRCRARIGCSGDMVRGFYGAKGRSGTWGSGFPKLEAR